METQAIRRQVLSEAAPKVRNIRTQYSPIAHHAISVATDIPVADVIAPEDQDIRLLGSSVRRPSSPVIAFLCGRKASPDPVKARVDRFRQLGHYCSSP